MGKTESRASTAGPARRFDIALLTFIASLTLGYCAILALRLPVFTSMRGWFWPLHTKPLPVLWLCLPLFGAGAATVWLATAPRVRLVILLPTLMLVAYAFQLGFGYVEGRGINGLRDRIVNTGHAGFAVTAARQPSLLRVAARYEPMLASGELPFYPNATKPPGQLLFYMLTERLSRPFGGLMPAGFSPLDRLRTFASFFFPFLACLALLPLAWLARMLMPSESVGRALVLFPLLPSLTLITLHLDQCLYPLLALVSISLFVYGMERGRAWPVVLSGVTFYLALYVSFSLVAIAPLLVLTVLFAALLGPRQPGLRRPLLRQLANLGLFAAGFALLLLAFAVVFRYDPLVRYRNAMALHTEWKMASWSGSDTLHFGLLDLLEFSCWVGMPVTVLFLVDQSRTVARAGRRTLQTSGALAAALGVTLLTLAFAGRTAAETARLWLFAAPLVVLFAGRALSESRLLRGRSGLISVVLLQFVTIVFIKTFQDFW